MLSDWHQLTRSEGGRPNKPGRHRADQRSEWWSGRAPNPNRPRPWGEANCSHDKPVQGQYSKVVGRRRSSSDVWRLTDKRGVDIAIDNVGLTLPETLRCMAQGGIVVVLGNVGGDAVLVPPGLLIGSGFRVSGSGMATLEDVRQSLAMLQAGMIQAVITASLKFSEAAKAHSMIEARAVEGRVVLQGW